MSLIPSKLYYVLFHFSGGDPGIGTISSIKSPSLEEKEEDNYLQIKNVWIRERTKLVVR